MRNAFTDANNMQCIFDDEGVTFADPKQEVFFPYGSIDNVKLSMLGVLQIASIPTVCTFLVDRKDRSAVKAMVKHTQQAMKTAPKAKPRVIDLSKSAGDVDADLSPEEQLKHYKALFVQGVISKEEYDAHKRQLRA